METLMAIEWVAVIAAASLLIGFGVAWLIFGGATGSKKKVAELESALETAQEEMEDYKREVYGQFSETADKFRALDKSYHDLHRQLATSSVALLGDQDMPLLLNDRREEVAEHEEIVVDEARLDDAPVQDSPVSEVQVDEMEVGDVQVDEVVAQESVVPEVTQDSAAEPAVDLDHASVAQDDSASLDEYLKDKVDDEVGPLVPELDDRIDQSKSAG